jgi:hypothetical protein
MDQIHSLGWLRELALIVVREALSALPYEFTLDGRAEAPLGQRQHTIGCKCQ